LNTEEFGKNLVRLKNQNRHLINPKSMKKLNHTLLFYTCLLALGFFLAGCQSSEDRFEARERRAITESKLIYGLDDEALNFLGDRFGYHVEALGMGEYSFTRGDQSFQVMVHNDMLSRDRIRATEPVVLSYEAHAKRSPLESRFSVSQGVTIEEVEQHFCSFMRHME